MARPKDRWTGEAPPGPFNDAFAALKGAQVPETQGEPSTGAAAQARGRETAPTGGVEPRGPARAVVRLEKKGRGGKQVTVVEQLALPARELEQWSHALKQALGCGGTVEGASIVVQGDHRERARAFLQARGVRKISVG